MPEITLSAPWTYRTPQKTINYGAGTHHVPQSVAERADAEGAIASAEIGSPDPLDGSVPELTDYLATVDDVAELRRLRAAEVGGKTRTTAIDAIDVRIAEIEAGGGEPE